MLDIAKIVANSTKTLIIIVYLHLNRDELDRKDEKA